MSAAIRILIVEDEQIVAAGLRKRLLAMGYQVPAVATSGEVAIRVAEDLRPDLVLMDIQLDGDMDGIEAAARIRRFHIPVVYLTAYSNAETLERAKVTEPFGYILKPYEDRELQVVAETALYKHRTERILQERERWLAAVLHSIGDGVIATDEAARIKFLNPVAEQLTGWTTSEAVGQRLDDVMRLVHEPTGAAVESPVHRALRERLRVYLEDNVLMIARDQKERPVEDCASTIQDEEGRLGAVMVFRDVSDRRRLEAQFRQAQKMEAIGRLAGGVAHDFNNLLTIINGCSQLLQNMLQNDATAQRLAAEISKAGDRAATLTKQLLGYSRRQLQQLQAVDLNELVRQMESMLRRLIGEDLELTTVLAADLHPIKADPAQLEQVVMNLVINARDAMPTGGALTIETKNIRLASPNEESLFAMPAGDYASLIVSDTGCGMDAATQAHIFEPFFTTKQEKGTGLGLATVYGIVKQTRGFIKVYSEPGCGTTFKIYFPSLHAVDRPAAPSTDLSGMPTGTETILLVEDEEAVRSIAETILVRCGYRVLVAGSGIEALAQASQHDNLDLLVTDVVMPKMSGRQLVEILRKTAPGLPVLYLSGYTEDTVLRHGVLESEATLLEKPFTARALAAKVRETLDNAKRHPVS